MARIPVTTRHLNNVLTYSQNKPYAISAEVDRLILQLVDRDLACEWDRC